MENRERNESSIGSREFLQTLISEDRRLAALYLFFSVVLFLFGIILLFHESWLAIPMLTCSAAFFWIRRAIVEGLRHWEIVQDQLAHSSTSRTDACSLSESDADQSPSTGNSDHRATIVSLPAYRLKRAARSGP